MSGAEIIKIVDKFSSSMDFRLNLKEPFKECGPASAVSGDVYDFILFFQVFFLDSLMFPSFKVCDQI